jgi:4-hydroxy-L-threonine phosphate dehydrogenase PdxA
MSQDRVIAVTMGDPTGIGPEIVAKVFAEDTQHRAVVVGDVAMMRRAVDLLGLPLTVNPIHAPSDARFEPGTIDVVAATELPEDLPFGVIDARGGGAAYEYVRRAVELASADEVHAIATAPLNKEAMHLAGFRYPGHTEVLAELTGVRDYAMMLVTDDLRVVHVSTHVALSEAIRRVQPERELTVIRLADRSLRLLGVERPRVAVAGLNPHAGEAGLFGTEDRDVIARHRLHAGAPGPLRHRRRPVPRPGPHPDQADGLRHRRERDGRAAVLPHERRPRHGVRHRRHRPGRPREHARRARPGRLAGAPRRRDGRLATAA